MGTWLRNLFTAPTFADEEQTRAARLLHVTLLVLLVLTVGVTTLLLIFYGLPDTLGDAYTLLSGAGMAALCVLFFFLHRRGHTRLVAFLLLMMLWALVTAWAVLIAGISGKNSFLIYTFLIALAGLLLGGGPAMAMTWLSALGVLAAYYAEVAGFVRPTFQPAGVADLLTTIPVLFLTGLLLRYAARIIAQGFARARLREQELRESNSQLTAARAILEERAGRLQAVVQECVECLTAVARGDLAARVAVAEVEGDAPLTMLRKQLNETIGSLQQMTVQLRDTAGSLASASAEILAAATQQAGGAGEQSAAIGQATATIDEVQAIAEQTVRRAEDVVGVARRTMAVSQAGRQAVAEAIAGMGSVREQVEAISTTILTLSEQTQAIGGIIATVGNIAKQSNLLALNAAVEAARAGEAGRGFAVVAGEVRALAEQSRAATAQIEEILRLIQGGVNSAVLATEAGLKGTQVGARLTGEAGEAISRLAESVAESAQAAEQIAAAAGQQRTGMEQLASAMHNIQQATAQSLRSAEQTKQAAAGLNELAGRLEQLVAQYRG